jgi:hypothetical protein
MVAGFHMKKVLGILGILIATLVAGAIGKVGGRAAVEAVSRPSQPDMAVKMEEAAANLRKQLPMRVDEISVLNGVFATPNTFTFIGRMETEIPKSRRPLIAQQIKEVNAPNMCRLQRRALETGIRFNYQMVDNAGYAINYTIALADCPPV